MLAMPVLRVDGGACGGSGADTSLDRPCRCSPLRHCAGIFHGAVEYENAEYSFGFCPYGT